MSNYTDMQGVIYDRQGECRLAAPPVLNPGSDKCKELRRSHLSCLSCPNKRMMQEYSDGRRKPLVPEEI